MEEVGGGGTTPALPQPAVGECHAPRWTQKARAARFSLPPPSGARAAFGRPGADILYPSVAQPVQYSRAALLLHSPNPTLDEVLPHHPRCNGLATTYYCW